MLGTSYQYIQSAGVRVPQEQINAAQGALAQADVDYEGTMAAKLLIARLLFDREGAALLQVVHCGVTSLSSCLPACPHPMNRSTRTDKAMDELC